MKELYPWLWILAIAVIFWLLVVRPAARRQKETLALQAALAVGDDVMLTSGVFGTIVGEADDHLRLEVAPGVVIRVVRGAVASVRRDDVDAAAEAPLEGTTGPAGTTPVERHENEER